MQNLLQSNAIAPSAGHWALLIMGHIRDGSRTCRSWGNVRLEIKAREYRCANDGSNVATIAESFDGFLDPYSRMTERCADFIYAEIANFIIGSSRKRGDCQKTPQNRGVFVQHHRIEKNLIVAAST